jgi:hypothetical protein
MSIDDITSNVKRNDLEITWRVNRQVAVALFAHRRIRRCTPERRHRENHFRGDGGGRSRRTTGTLINSNTKAARNHMPTNLR